MPGTVVVAVVTTIHSSLVSGRNELGSFLLGTKVEGKQIELIIPYALWDERQDFSKAQT